MNQYQLLQNVFVHLGPWGMVVNQILSIEHFDFYFFPYSSSKLNPSKQDSLFPQNYKSHDHLRPHHQQFHDFIFGRVFGISSNISYTSWTIRLTLSIVQKVVPRIWMEIVFSISSLLSFRFLTWIRPSGPPKNCRMHRDTLYYYLRQLDLHL